MGKAKRNRFTFHPLTKERWSDFERLFGPRGACAGCWCMWWRLTRSQFEKQQGEGNRKAMKKIVGSGEVPGILAFDGKKPVAWCSVSPRTGYPSLNRSRILKPIDGKPVWSLVCFYIAKEYRGQGLGVALIRAAIAHVRGRRGEVIEAYPAQPKSRKMSPFSTFMGLPSMFKQAGFEECARPSKSKIIMRFYIKGRRKRPIQAKS